MYNTPDFDDMIIGDTGETDFTVAVRQLENYVKFLIDRGASVNLHIDHGRITLLSMAEWGSKNAEDMVVATVQAQLDAQDDTAADPQLRFILAAYHGNVDEVALLSQKGCLDAGGSDTAIGNLALFLAVEHQDGAMVNALLHAGIKINVKDTKGQTVLFRATRHQDAAMIKLLVSGQIEIDSRDDKGRTAWSANVGSRNKDILDLLLKAGADPSTRDLQGVSPLYEAASNGEADMVRFLLESGTNPSIQTEYEWAPIHWASSFGHKDCVQLLIDAGADVNVRSEQGVTALDLATQSNQTAIVEILKNSGAMETKLAENPSQRRQARIEPPLSTAVIHSPSSPLEYKLFLAFDNPLSPTLVQGTNIGHFLYPRVHQDSPEPAGYIYQVSDVMETTSTTTIAVRRAARRAQMSEYPMQPDDFNFTDVIYHIDGGGEYKDFLLTTGAQTALYDQAMPQPTAYYMWKDWRGNWSVWLHTENSSRLIFRTAPDCAVQSYSQDCHWMTDMGNLLARSGWEDGTPNMCIEPALEVGIVDLLMACGIAKFWSEWALHQVEGASEEILDAAKEDM